MFSLLAPTLSVAAIARPSAAAGIRYFASGKSSVSASEEELEAARSWLDQFHAESLPKIGKLTFCASAKPGGQNVNRVNSKATLRMDLDALLRHIPRALHGELKSSRYVAERSNAIIIQADDSRKQSDNAHSCYKRLYEAIVDAGRKAIPGETSAEQATRVKNLQKSDNERRLKSKKQHSAKKGSRRSRGDD